jgi:hypothetical protein
MPTLRELRTLARRLGSTRMTNRHSNRNQAPIDQGKETHGLPWSELRERDKRQLLAGQRPSSLNASGFDHRRTQIDPKLTCAPTGIARGGNEQASPFARDRTQALWAKAGNQNQSEMAHSETQPSDPITAGLGLTTGLSRWRRDGPDCGTAPPHTSKWHYFFVGAALSAAAGAPSEFQVSRRYSHFPPFFTETERYFPVSTTLPALSLTT